MKDLSVPELRLFSQSPISYNEYKHKIAIRHELANAGNPQIPNLQNRYKYTDQMRESSRRTSRQRFISAERDYRSNSFFQHALHAIPIHHEPIPLAAPVPMPLPVPVPLLQHRPPPVLLPLPILRTDPVCRASRVCTMNVSTSPCNKYYEMSKKVLQDMGRSSPRESRRTYTYTQKENTNRSYEVENQRGQQYQGFSISKEPYLTEPVSFRNIEQRQPQRPAEAEPRHPPTPTEPPKKGIQVISQPQPRRQPVPQAPKPVPPPIAIPSPKPQPKLPSPHNIPPPPPPPRPPPPTTLQSFHKEQLQRFIDLLQHERISFEEYRQTHQKQWIILLEQINRLKREDQPREMKKRVREWKRRNFSGLDEITENVSTYSEVTHNDSMIRRELREIEETHIKFDRKLGERYQEIEEYDFELERNMKEKKNVDISEVIKLKNEDLQLYRDITSEISDLIAKYQGGTVKNQRKVFSFFD